MATPFQLTKTALSLLHLLQAPVRLPVARTGGFEIGKPLLVCPDVRHAGSHVAGKKCPQRTLLVRFEFAVFRKGNDRRQGVIGRHDDETFRLEFNHMEIRVTGDFLGGLVHSVIQNVLPLGFPAGGSLLGPRLVHRIGAGVTGQENDP